MGVQCAVCQVSAFRSVWYQPTTIKRQIKGELEQSVQWRVQMWEIRGFWCQSKLLPLSLLTPWFLYMYKSFSKAISIAILLSALHFPPTCPLTPLHSLFDFFHRRSLCFKINERTLHFHSWFWSNDFQQLHGGAFSTLERWEIHSFTAQGPVSRGSHPNFPL